MLAGLTLTSPIRQLYGVGDQLAEKFSKIGVKTAQDLFELLPHRAEDRSQLRLIRELRFDEEVVISGTITRVSTRMSKRGVLIIDARIRDDSGSIAAIWFNQKYLLKNLVEDERLTIYGIKRLVPSMGNPFFVKKIITQLEIAPIYPTTAGLNQATINRLLRQLRPLLADMPEMIPGPILAKLKLPTRRLALEAAHFAPTTQTIEQARDLLGFEELLILCLRAQIAKATRHREAIRPLELSDSELTAIRKHFDFSLTVGQEAALKIILEDLARTYPMNRLLYGEVGSGKTAIGLIAAAVVARNGKKVVWLSPTTTLAAQQAHLTEEFCKNLQLRCAVLTGTRKDGYQQANIVVGTHAILQERIKLDNVGLVVIDEQHRFGVDQRNYLLQNHPNTHLLMLTATPIPRTLAHTLFGHLDVSYLTEKPSHQKPVTTYVFTDKDRSKIEKHIAKRLAAKQPGYIICPLIDGGSDPGPNLFQTERKAVKTELERIKTTFPTAVVGILHGRMKPEEKERVMADFTSGKLDILLSTSVVEVGIDNPRASWILIEEADRFGLSQLHQLRGRVGRGSQESICFLANSETTEHATERLNALAKVQSGLEIAEYDLRWRGPGNIAGYEQSGLPNLRYADIGNIEVIKKAYAAAQELVESGLKKYPSLKAKVATTHNELSTA